VIGLHRTIGCCSRTAEGAVLYERRGGIIEPRITSLATTACIRHSRTTQQRDLRLFHIAPTVLKKTTPRRELHSKQPHWNVFSCPSFAAANQVTTLTRVTNERVV